MADISDTLAAWSSTSNSNAPSGATTIGTGLAPNLREIQGVIVRGLSHKGTDIPSVAGTTDIGAVEGLMNDVTGTEIITGLGTVRAGLLKVLKFEAAATLTHNATSLILPGAANITCADGDVGVFISEGSGNWRCLSYTKAGYAPSVPPGSWALINTYTPTDVASQAITGFDSTKYTDYRVVIDRMAPATDNADVFMRTSSDGGSSFDSAGSSYYSGAIYHGGASAAAAEGGSTTSMSLTVGNGVGNATSEAISIDITVIAPGTAAWTRFIWQLQTTRAAGTHNVLIGSGLRLATADVDALQILFSTGNIASGTIRFYGLRKP